jgi:HK97 family phage major capsid protein
MNRKELIKAFRDEGYAEANPSLDSLKAYAESNGITFKDADGVVDLTEAWDTKSEVTVGNVQPARKDNTEAAKKAVGRVVRAVEGEPQSFVIGKSAMAKKAFNAKAARGLTIFPDADTAEFAGASLRYNIAKTLGTDYNQKGLDVDIIKTAITLDNSNAAALVPLEQVASLIYETEPVGVARTLVNVQPMGSDQQAVPRKTGIGSMSWVNEAGAITETDQSFDTINLVAKKMGRIVKASSEIMEDSAIGFAEVAAASIRESYDLALDLALVLGDGTSTYGGITGLANSANVSTQTGTGSGWTGLVAKDFRNLMAKVKNVQWNRSRFFCTREFYLQVMLPLDEATSQFRVLSNAVMPGGGEAMFMGKPVSFIPSITGMPIETGATQRACYFGDFIGGATLGERRNLTVDFSKEAYWSSDIVAWKATARATISIHGSGRSGNSNIAALVTG